MSRFWIQEAIKRPGRLTRFAKSKHLSMSKAINKAKKSKNRSLKFAAILAERLRKMRRK